MKQIKNIILAAFALLLSIVEAGAQAVAPNNEGMTMTAHEWCQAVKAGWNLGNSLESAGATWNASTQTWTNVTVADYDKWETAWGNPATTKAMIDAVKKAGFNAIRIPVRWEPHCSDHTTMAISEKWLARVKEIVGWCLENDMYVILNTHHELWLENRPTNACKASNIAMLKALWTNIANAFMDYDQRLAFAGINEVQVDWKAPTTENNSVMAEYNQAFVDAVRATGGRNYYRNLIVQTYSCSPYYGKSYLQVPADKVENRLSVEFHYYDPYSYCSGNTGSGYYYYWGTEYKNQGKATPAENENTIKNLFNELKTKWYDKGLGVVIGEYGVSDHYTTAEKAAQHECMSYYLKTLVSYIRQYGFAGFAWDNNVFGNGSEKFGIFDRRNNMNIKADYLYKGIMDGAGIEYDPNTGGGSGDITNPDYGTAGKVVWSGEADLAWGDGLQFNIDASEFANFKPGDKVVFYSRYKAMKDGYNLIQLFYGDWSANPSFYVNGEKTAVKMEFAPTNYCSDQDNMITELTFDQSIINIMKTKGLVVQGYGLTLTQALVVIYDPDAIVVPEAVSTGKMAVYNLQGMRVANPSKGIYIIDGKKVMLK